MQALVFAKALDDSITRLKLGELTALLDPGFAQPGHGIPPATKASFSNLIFEQDSALQALLASAPTADVVRQFISKTLISREARGNLLTKFNNASSFSNVTGDSQFVALWHSLHALLAVRDAFTSLVVEPRTTQLDPGTETLVLELIDYDSSGVRVDRLLAAIDALLRLYDAVERAVGASQHAPTVQWADSGSDVNFGINGVAETVLAIKEAFADAWNAVRFRKNQRIERNITTVTAQLTLLNTIESRVSSGALDRHTADVLKHQVSNAMRDLIGVGAMPPDVSNTEEYDRREVLTAARETKLLGPGSADGADAHPPEGNDS